MRAEDDYLLDFDAPIPEIERAKLLWVNYPNNPTGAVASLEFYERALAFCRAHHLLLCSDNPYVDVTFDDYRAPSVMQFPDAKSQSVEFMSLSKSHNMAGWRLGACVGNAEALNKLLVVKSTIDSAHFRAIYDAGTAALNTTPESWLAERNARYASRRDTLLSSLPDLGLTAARPLGTLYIWAHIADGRTDREYAESALTETCVSITPGTTYGPTGDHYLRFSLGISEARLAEALDRLREWHAHTVRA
jgi:LL-diaminopimelate aminotransferase